MEDAFGNALALNDKAICISGYDPRQLIKCKVVKFYTRQKTVKVSSLEEGKDFLGNKVSVGSIGVVESHQIMKMP